MKGLGVGALKRRARLDIQTLEALKDRTFRRLPGLRVKGERSALQFINQVEFCSLFEQFGGRLPCLYVACCGRRSPRWPHHTHHDPEIGLAWDLKDTLPARKLVYYGKLIQGKPTLVSLTYFPAFYGLYSQRTRYGSYLEAYRAGLLSRTAKRLLDVLTLEGNLYTPELRFKAGLFQRHQTREFERAIGELQRGMWVVKTEERYDPTFAYRWDLLPRWLPGEVRQGSRVDRAEAAYQIVRQYLSVVYYARPGDLVRLFALSLAEVQQVLDRLEAEGEVLPNQPIRGMGSRWLVARPQAA